jgi:hypothetical protein
MAGIIGEALYSKKEYIEISLYDFIIRGCSARLPFRRPTKA